MCRCLQVDGLVESNHGGEAVQATQGQQLHSSAVTAVAYNSDTDTVATCGADGAIHTIQHAALLIGRGADQLHTVKAGTPYASISGICWSAGGALLSVGTAGSLQCWDARAKGPAQRASAQSGAQGGHGRELLGVAAHPGQPQSCVVTEVGGVSLWDVRKLAGPVAALQEGTLEGYVQARFDTRRMGRTDAPLIAATTAGQLCQLDLGRHNNASETLATEDAAFVAVDAEPLRGELLFACTDCASLTIVDRAQLGIAAAV